MKEVGSLGGIVAAALSYIKWHSFWLAVGHFWCGWIYVIYHIATYGVPHIQ